MLKQTLCATALIAATLPALAGEIAPDTVLNAGNYESLKNETLGGRSLDSLLSDTQKWMIREKSLSMRLQPQWQAPGLPADLKETTDKYRGQTQLDGANNRISSYTAGIPFPDIDVADPDAAKKIVWNNYLAGPIGYTSSSDLGFALFSMDRGFERKNSWFYRRLYMSGRYGTAEATLDGGKEHYRQILYAYYPEDIRGLGTVTYRYMDGRLDDIFAYVKSVRRIRRLSGGAWFDPIGGTDLLSDEPWILSGYPGWYRDQKLVEKRWQLMPVGDPKSPGWVKNAKSRAEEYPYIETEQKPYGMPKLQWVPREVYVIEVAPPTEHYYSRKTWYCDVEYPIFHMADNYDKAGNLWKVQFLPRLWREQDTPEGRTVLGPIQTDYLLNVKDSHVTVVTFVLDSWKFNDPREKPADYVPNILSEIAAGRR
jgi:hypothetical protein